LAAPFGALTLFKWHLGHKNLCHVPSGSVWKLLEENGNWKAAVKMEVVMVMMWFHKTTNNRWDITLHYIRCLYMYVSKWSE